MNVGENQERARRIRQSILMERTRGFAGVDLDEPEEILAFRSNQEHKEAGIERHDPETYVCPFLGYVSLEGRMGCMLHPRVTGRPRLQNHSFYGHSICQAYDCVNKDAPDAVAYSEVLTHFFPAHHEHYARLMADHAFYRLFAVKSDFWEVMADLLRESREQKDYNVSFNNNVQYARRALRFFLLLRLATNASAAMTSFEILMHSFQTPRTAIDLQQVFGVSLMHPVGYSERLTRCLLRFERLQTSVKLRHNLVASESGNPHAEQ
ncbi:MAG: hypothetical protein KDK30_04220 [Leptospiraceae bacterium]|nr:hypothetical protein [Leptospiraceae bacterium]